MSKQREVFKDSPNNIKARKNPEIIKRILTRQVLISWSFKENRILFR